VTTHRRRLRGAGTLAAVAVCLAAAGPGHASDTTPRLGGNTMIFPSVPGEAVDGLFAATRAAHLGMARVDIQASALFPRSEEVADWSTLDLASQAGRQYGVKVLGLLYGVPMWLSSCSPFDPLFYRCPPRDYGAWARIVARIAARVPDVRHWEVLNEANLTPGYFHGGPVEYARFLRVTSKALRRGNPRARILFTSVVPEYRAWLRRVLRQPGTLRSFDIANAHLRGGVAKLDEMVRAALRDFGALGFHGPLWVTEAGYPSDPAYQFDPHFRGTDLAGGERAQAAYVVCAARNMLAAGARRVFLPVRDLEAYRGLFASEGLITWPVRRAKPAYTAVTRLARRLASRAARGPSRRGSGRERERRRRARAPGRGSGQHACPAVR